jgi:hypothetical protein
MINAANMPHTNSRKTKPRDMVLRPLVGAGIGLSAHPDLKPTPQSSQLDNFLALGHVADQPGHYDHRQVDNDESEEAEQPEEMDRAGRLAVPEQTAVPLEVVVDCWRHRQASQDLYWRQDEDHTEAGELLKGL